MKQFDTTVPLMPPTPGPLSRTRGLERRASGRPVQGPCSLLPAHDWDARSVLLPRVFTLWVEVACVVIDRSSTHSAEVSPVPVWSDLSTHTEGPLTGFRGKLRVGQLSQHSMGKICLY